MLLDHILHQQITGVYSMPNLAPQIPHPVILGDGMHFYCLSTSPAADGTRAGDWYLVNLAGVRPVCACRAYSPKTGCKHVSIVAAQVDALCKARTARWAAERQAARAQTMTEGVVIPPPVKGPVAA
jgi:hypothetical protein